VQVILSVVLEQRIGLAIETEFGVGNAVSIATHHRSEIGFVHRVDVVLDARITQGDIRHVSFAIWNQNGRDDRAIVGDLDRHARLVL